MAKLIASLLSWLDLDHPVESLEEDIKAVEGKARASIVTLYLAGYDSQKIKDSEERQRVQKARTAVDQYCQNRKIKIIEILVEKKSFNKLEDQVDHIQQALKRNINVPKWK